MGKDVFWAIRGGGATSFGVILSWKIKLVRVPPRVYSRCQGHWNKVQRSLFIIGNKLHQNCRRISLLDSSLSLLTMAVTVELLSSIEVLLDKVRVNRSFSKTKSDYYKTLIPKQGLETLWEAMMDIEDMMVQMNPYGGRMEEISESETAFVHRGENLFMVMYMVLWSESEGGIDATARHVELSRRLYRAMAPYASSNPREAFLNYRDLDVGSKECNGTDFAIAKEYGTKYFRNNFIRLAGVKAMIDPENFFNNEQSIPPLPVRATH
ncbi:hypothetical protein V6N11_032853 [Hibiscus sabdariffa]|uniref:Berberine/berberine-like domain-containing protein n=1 Tax=Hibiscus sabdariffa TaxID=183260 RepID=A0ABR2T2H4_9ROSI